MIVVSDASPLIAFSKIGQLELLRLLYSQLLMLGRSSPRGFGMRWGCWPPHVQETEARAEAYIAVLKEAGADVVVRNIEELNGEMVNWLVEG